jgi:hypothetical protein
MALIMDQLMVYTTALTMVEHMDEMTAFMMVEEMA